MQVDTQYHISWASCIAVIYAIDDRSSFNTAENILQNIKTFVEKSGKVREAMPLRYSLIANKNDLEHLRVISSDEGKALAKSFNARFCEISAANDYLSIYEPFSTMIREAYASVESSKQINSYDYLKPEQKSRVRSHTLSPMSERSRTNSDFDVNFFKWNTKHDDDSISITSTHSAMENPILKRYSLSETLENLISTDLNSNGNGLSNFEEKKDFLDVQDESLISRAHSWGTMKKEMSRSSLKRSEKQRSLKKSGKSRSYSDLASSVWEQNEFDTHIFLPDGENKNEDSDIFLSEKLPTEKLPVANLPKNGWSILRKERPKLLANMNAPKNENNSNESSRDIQEPQKFKRGDSRSSVRKKFSTIFKPKIQIVSPTFAN